MEPTPPPRKPGEGEPPRPPKPSAMGCLIVMAVLLAIESLLYGALSALF